MAKQITVPEINFDTVLDVVGTIAAAYLGWLVFKGEPIPVLKEFTPFVGAATFGIVGWRIFRRNNK